MSGCPGIAGGSAGFSRKSTMRPVTSVCMTPKPDASSRGTVRQPTVTLAPVSTC